MANIKKSFNFRNGVQVDEDNLLVTSTGLVAIGKTVPTEALDVIGNVIISGVTSSVFSQTGVLTVTSLEPTTIIGAGVSVVSGVVTSNSGSGIVTYYGDARFLQGMPTSQWQDTNAGFGVSSIYNTGGTVGIATTNPQSTLQVGNDPFSSGIGVGIASAGNIRASGTITATTLVGAVTGNVTGDITGNITGDVTGNLTGLVNSAGISTFAGINATGRIVGAAVSNVIPFFYSNFSDLPSPVTYHGAFAHVHSTGRGYYAHGGAWIELVNKNTSGNVILDKDLDVDGHTELDNVNIAGVTTFASNIDANADIDVNGDIDVTGGITATGVISGQQVSGTVSVNTAALNATNGTFASTGSLSAQGGISVKDLRIATGSNRTLITTPVGVATVTISGGDLKLQDKIFIDGTNPELRSEGNITLSQKGSNLAKIGVGTISPENDIQVRRFTGNAEIQVTADSGAAGITVGREPATANTNNAEFRYGLVSTGSPNSSAQSLDIINYGTDNFNYFLSAANPGAVDGDFQWHRGFNSATLMTLTGIGGSLGIGITNPTTKLEVDGGAKFSGAVEITNTLTLGVPLNSNVVGNVTGNLTGDVTGNINSTAGLSTTRNFFVSQGLGIGVTDSGNKVNIGSTLDNRIFINNDSQIGIKTDIISDTNVVVEILGNVRLKKAVSVGDTTRSAVDFSDAVNITNEGETGLPFNRSQLAYMIPPRVDNAQRNLLRDAHTNSATLLSGAMIFNTDINKLQVYNGTTWETVTSS